MAWFATLPRHDTATSMEVELRTKQASTRVRFANVAETPGPHKGTGLHLEQFLDNAPDV